MVEISRQNRHNANVVLHLLLIAALAWLPMAGFAADVFPEMATATSEFEIKAVNDGVSMAHMHHAKVGHTLIPRSQQVDGSHQKRPLSIFAEPTHIAGNDCSGHQAPCCTACVPYCGTSIFIPSPNLSPRLARSRQFSDTLTVVVLSRDIRPPIS